jgi:uncharacterized repeat protein (TIGR02543 family)
VKTKRLLAVLLCVCMLVSVLPIQALAADTASPFTDVTRGQWFYEAANYVYNNGIFNGTSRTEFSPYGRMTRAMFVTILGRMAGIDPTQYGGKSDFTDVLTTDYFAPYVAWAVEKGITTGKRPGKFAPNDLVTREEIAAFTVRFLTALAYGFPDDTTQTKPLDDAACSAWARSAVEKLWACALFQGDERGNFNPRNNATRAECAVFAMRLHKWLTGAADTTEKTNSTMKTNTVTFDTMGGESLGSRNYGVGTQMRSLPAAYKDGYVFVSWYYDQALTKPVASTDIITQNMKLYAGYTQASLQEEQTPHTASALNVAQSFSVTVLSSDPKMTAAQVKAAIAAQNLNAPDDTDVIQVTGSNGTYTVTSSGSGFTPGATYKLTLDNSALHFSGCETTVREYSFTTAGTEKNNLRLSSGLRYLKASEVSNMTRNGKPVTTLEIPLVTVDGTGSSGSGTQTGTFVYAGSPALQIGDTVAVYEGTEPDKRTNADKDGAVAYVTVTAVDPTTNTYSFQNADAASVLFVPDVLPLSTAADTDSSTSTVTVPASALDYSADRYAAMGLDSQTTADAGDFLAFYSGTDPILEHYDSYGLIASVTKDDKTTPDPADDTVTIAYTSATEKDITSSMSVYQSPVQTSLTPERKDLLEKKVETQAVQSGFADQVAKYMTALVLSTDTFSKLDDDSLTVAANAASAASGSRVTVAAESANLSSIVDSGLAGEGAMSLVPKKEGEAEVDTVETKISTVKATIDTTLKHFSGMEGLRVHLELGVKITIHMTDSSDIEINLTCKFDQEVRMDLSMDSYSVWDGWKLEDYNVTANLDFYEYSGVNVEATLATKKADSKNMGTDDKDLQDIGKKLKDLMEARDNYIGDGNNTASESLRERYRDMLGNDSDWIPIVDQELTSQSGPIDTLHILEYNVKLEFLIKANANVALGSAITYETANRYTYNVRIFDRTVTSDTAVLVPEHYTFTLYVMGTLGLKVGVKASICVGLISTKLDSVGFTAEAGVYLRLWGYFYYQVGATKVGGVYQYDTNGGGALLIELGIYLDVRFLAQAFDNTFTYNPALYSHEWPILTAGARRNVQDFAYAQANAPSIAMKRTLRTVSIPKSVFNMSYMDLKSGEDGTAYYGNKDYTITMTNSAFTYDQANGTITVTPGSQEEIYGEMIVTWNSATLAFSANPIVRRISLSWDNYNDGYCLGFDSNGGSYIPMIVAGYKTAIAAPASPVKEGYTFAGWYSDKALTKPYTIPATMPAADVLVYAKWTPRTDTKYTVEYYKERLGGGYDLADTEDMTGTTDAQVAAPAKSYAGFQTPARSSAVIKPNGSTVAQYYYTRNSYTITFRYGDADNTAVTSTFRFGAAVSAPSVYRAGYAFQSWSPALPSVMPAENLSYTANWTANDDTPYRVEVYAVSGAKSEYLGMAKLTGTSGASVAVSADLAAAILSDLLPDGIDGLTYSKCTVDGKECTSAQIAGDGSLVFKLYYTRNAYTLTFQTNLSDGVTGIPAAQSHAYGEYLTEPTPPEKTGYVFMGWYTDADMTQKAAFGTLTMPATDLTLYGKLELNTQEGYYQIRYVGLYGATNSNPDQYKSADGLASLAAPGTRTGYTFGGWFTDEGCTQAVPATDVIPKNSTGDMTFYVKWDAARYTITYNNLNGGTNTSNPTSYSSTDTVTLAAPTRAGYTFDGWYSNADLTTAATGIEKGSTGDKSFWAKWKGNAYTVSFNSNGGTGTMADQSFVSGTAQTLSPNTFTKTGHTFAGWAKTSGASAADYSDKQSVSDLTTTAQITLYAVWKLAVYTITYDNMTGAVNDAGNPANYTYSASNPVLLKDATKTGYAFEGWYTTSSYTGLTTQIAAGATGDITLYAKWGDLNVVSVAYTSTTNNVSTFTISRTGSTVRPITVSYHTMNGSAIGGTNFTHASGAAIIPAGAASVNVTVTEQGANVKYNNNTATAYSNSARVYFLQLDSATGGSSLSATGACATRTMPLDSSYSVGAAVFTDDLNGTITDFTTNADGGSTVYNSHSGFVGDTSGSATSRQVAYKTPADSYGCENWFTKSSFKSRIVTAYGQNVYNYLMATCGYFAYACTISVSEIQDGYLHVWVGDHAPSNNLTTDSYSDAPISHLATSGWGYAMWTGCVDVTGDSTFSAPTSSISNTNATLKGYENDPLGQSPECLFDLSTSDAIWVCFGATGFSYDEYSITGFSDHVRPVLKNLEILGIAPMAEETAFGSDPASGYIAGRTATIAVVFNEIIYSADSVTLTTNLSDTAFACSGGAGTNVLYFTGKIDKNVGSGNLTYTLNNQTNILRLSGTHQNTK